MTPVLVSDGSIYTTSYVHNPRDCAKVICASSRFIKGTEDVVSRDFSSLEW